jgi:UDP-N-acetylglucosamine 2-epimerase (non-hydrolysing)
MKISIIVGTRPEIIKMSPIIRECEKLNLDYFILHTGQHYSYNMDRIFFKQLEVPRPKYNLDVGSGSHAEQTGKVLIGVEKILKKENPDIVLVEGDTNTVLAGALAATKLHIPVGHVEAGLRSHDHTMPEEINRVLTDHLSNYLFCPTKESADNCLIEGLPKKFIHITGNTIVDAVYQNLKISKKKSDIMTKLDLKKEEYILMTSHRQENVDDKMRFSNIINAMKSIDFPVIYPIHPRAKAMANKFGLLKTVPKHIKLIEPIGYLDFLQLENNARLIVTDSGGIQEEACILQKPCLTIRENTERPETVKVKANNVIGWKKENIIKEIKYSLNKKKKISYQNPYGDGHAGGKIIHIIKRKGYHAKL